MRPSHRSLRSSSDACSLNGCWQPLEYNEAVGYLMTAADHEEGVNLTYPEWRALIYVASQHDFSAPHLRLESDDEAVDADAAP